MTAAARNEHHDDNPRPGSDTGPGGPSALVIDTRSETGTRLVGGGLDAPAHVARVEAAQAAPASSRRRTRKARSTAGLTGRLALAEAQAEAADKRAEAAELALDRTENALLELLGLAERPPSLSVGALVGLVADLLEARP